MEIVKFKKLRGNLYEIVLDNGLSFKLYDDVRIAYSLCVPIGYLFGVQKQTKS